jgi:peroxiredoxin
MKLFAKAWLVAVALACVTAYSPKAAPATVGEKAPNFSLVQFDGKVFTLRDYRGGWVIITFWSVDCAPCVAELPDFAAFARSRAAVAKVAAVNVDNAARDSVKEYVYALEYKDDLIWLCDPSARIWKKFTTGKSPGDDSYPLPFTVAVDPSGKVADVFVGKREDLSRYLAGIIDDYQLD